MNFHKLRIHIVLLAFLLAVVIGLGANYLYEQTQVFRPLNAQLQEVAGVEAVDVEQTFLGSGKRALVELVVDPDAPLSVTFSGVRQILAETRGNFALHLLDSADSSLIRLFQRVKIAAEEAIATGEFTALENRVQSLAEDAGINWELAMDREFIYLSLMSDTHHLQRIISRGTNDGKIIIVEGEGLNHG